MNSNVTTRCYFVLFILFFATYSYFFQGGGWNQNIRICQIRAMLNQHTFAVDEYKEDSQDPPFEFVNSGDWSYRDGHYYSNKSPGLSFMALVPFGVTEYLVRYLLPSDNEQQIHVSAYVSTLFTTVICAAFLCLLIFFVSNHFLGLRRGDCLLVTLFFGCGTLIFSYSTTFYSHVPAAFFSFLSVVLTMYIKHDNPGRKKSTAVSAGFSAAIAVLVEPSTVLMLVCILAYLISFKEGRGYVSFFLLGCIPPGIVQGFYNVVCFGSPLSSSYQYANDAVMVRINGRLFGLPHLRNFIQLLFSSYRGLFISSPVLIMVLPGIIVALKQKKWMAEVTVSAVISFLVMVLIASFYAWHGGSAVGPRYLLPSFPFLFYLAIFMFRKYPKTFKTLGMFSCCINLAITLVGNEIPNNVKNPLNSVILTNIVNGNVSVNPVPFSNFQNYSLDTLATMEQWTPNHNAFNLGEIVFPHSLLSVVPLIGFWIIWWFFLWKKFVEQD